MQDRCRVADQRQRRAYALERIGITADREMTRLPPRGRAHLGKVHRQSLLQLPRPARGKQGGTRSPAADIDQEARAIRLGGRTSQGRGGGPGSLRRRHRANENDPPAHRLAGLA